jgi:dienelactone hydrolase
VDLRSSAGPVEVRPAVVICHGFKGFKDWGFFPKLAERLALAGFTAASFNFSGSGVGEGEEFDELERWNRQRPTADLADIATVVDYLAAQGARRVGLVGHSRGGGLAVLHAARDSRIKALVTWAAVERFMRWSPEEVRTWRQTGRLDVVNARTGQVLPVGLDALEDWEAHQSELDVLAAASRIAIPWLIVHGAEDESVPVEEGEHLRQAAAGGSGRVELLAVPGAGHTFGARHPWSGSTPELDLVMQRTAEFLGGLVP